MKHIADKKLRAIYERKLIKYDRCPSCKSHLKFIHMCIAGDFSKTIKQCTNCKECFTQ